MPINEITEFERHIFNNYGAIVDEVNINDYILQLIKVESQFNNYDYVYDIMLSYKNLSLMDTNTKHQTGATLPIKQIVKVIRQGLSKYTDYPMIIETSSYRKIMFYRMLMKKYSNFDVSIDYGESNYCLHLKEGADLFNKIREIILVEAALIREEMSPFEFTVARNTRNYFDSLNINLIFQNTKIGSIFLDKNDHGNTHRVQKTNEIKNLISRGYRSDNYGMVFETGLDSKYHGKGLGKMLYSKAIKEILKVDDNAYLFANEAIYNDKEKEHHAKQDERYTSLQAQKVGASLGKRYPSSGMIIFIGEKS